MKTLKNKSFLQNPIMEIKEKILASGKITKEELDKKIEAKLATLGGLISEEGAAHIVANEIGVTVTSTSSAELKLNDVLAGMRNVSVVAKVLKKYDVRTFGEEGKVANALIGDETGVMRLTFWNDKVAYFEKIKEDDVIEVQSGYTKENNGRVEMHMGNASHCIINPEGKTVEAKKPEPPKTKKLEEINDNDGVIDVLATIVQVYDPRFFASDDRGRKLSEEDAKGKENLTYNYVMNLFLDDGSSNMRAVLWKEQVQKMLNKSNEELIAIKDDAEKIEEIKNDLLGKIVKIRARVKKNAAYNNLELVVYEIDMDPEPVAQSETKKPEPVKPAEPTVDEELISIDDIDENI